MKKQTSRKKTKVKKVDEEVKKGRKNKNNQANKGEINDRNSLALTHSS